MREDSPKVRATKKRITDALMTELADEPIEKITVGEVCAAAHINRSTFYNHFADIYDVRDQCEQEVAEAAEDMLPKLMAYMLFNKGTFSAADVEKSIAPYYGYLNVLLNGGDPSFPKRLQSFAHDALTDLLPGKRLSEEQEYVFHAIASMQLGLMSHWLATGCSLPIEDLLILIRRLIRKGPRTALIDK